RLHGYNGDTGAVIYAGTDVMTGTRKWNSGIAARGSIYVANDNKVYAFRIPSGGTPTPTPTATATSTPTATAPATPIVTPTATARGSLAIGYRKRKSAIAGVYAFRENENNAVSFCATCCPNP